MKVKNKEINKSVQLSRATHQKIRIYYALNDKTITGIVNEEINN